MNVKSFVMRGLLAVLIPLLLCPETHAASTWLISEALNGGPGNHHSSNPAISADGKFVAFRSNAADLVANDVNGNGQDVFIYEKATGKIELVNLSASGDQTGGYFGFLDMSADGRFVVFATNASLAPEDTNNSWDVYLRDRLLNQTTRVTADISSIGYKDGLRPSISDDGRFIAFQSSLPSASGRYPTVAVAIVHDCETGLDEVVSPNMVRDGVEYFQTLFPSISADGRYVAFSVNDGSSKQIMVRDRQTDTLEYVSLSNEGQLTGYCGSAPSISGDGRYVAFRASGNLSPVRSNLFQIYVRDRVEKTTELVSISASGEPGDANNGDFHWKGTSISHDGRYVAFISMANNLTEDLRAGNSYFDVYVRDRLLGKTTLVSRKTEDWPANYGLNWTSGPVISGDGQLVAFHSYEPYLIADDTSRNYDVFLRRWADGPAYTVSAGPEQVVEQDSPSGATISLAGELTDGECADGEFEWSWPTGSASGQSVNAQLPPGTTEVALAWSGCGATAEGSVTVTVQDTLPPTTTFAFYGTPGLDGWYLSGGVASLGAADNGSGVREIRYVLNKAAETAQAGEWADVPVSGEGFTNLEFVAVDVAGNTSAVDSRSIAIDSIAPTVLGNLTGRQNNAGKYVTEVAVRLLATDATSGIRTLSFNVNGGAVQNVAGTSASLTLTEDGNHVIQSWAVDSAGNTSRVRELRVDIDKSQLARAVTEDLEELVLTNPPEAFDGTNPNNTDKLSFEINKVLAELTAADELDATRKLASYRWAQQKLQQKLLDEFNRIIVDPVELERAESLLAEAVAALEKLIAELESQP